MSANVRMDRGTAIRLSEMLSAGLTDVGRALAIMADALESGEASPADVALHLRAVATELQDIAKSV